MQLLLNAGADVNICNNHDDTPLIIACRYGGSTIQKMLIAAGADVNYRDGNGVTPLMGILRNFPDGLGLFKDFEHGLAIVARNTGEKSFKIGSSCIKNPDAFLSDLVVKSFKKDDTVG